MRGRKGRFLPKGALCRRRFIAAALAAGAAGCAPGASKAKGGDADIAALLAARIDVQRRGTGAAAGIVRGGVVSFLAHGVDGIGSTAAVGPDSVFQLASLTKIFTALLCADAVGRGELGWDDPLGNHLPVRVPQFGAAITLLDLATHSSGLPLRPASRLDRGQDDPYSGYSRAELLADIENAQLARAPGEAFEYSNFGFALLGEALANRLERPYAELLQERILAPLGLKETSLARSNELLVQGYDRDFAPMQPWDFGALAPAGGLFSSVRDITRFVKLWTAPRQDTLAAAARTMLTPLRAGDGPETQMAIGWRITRSGGRDCAWSNGSGGGVRAFMGLAPERRTGVVAFANMATGIGVDDIGMRALDPSYEVDVEPIPERAGLVLSPEILDRYVGVYSAGPGDDLTIERDGESLVLVLGKSVRIPLVAETETKFFMDGENISLEFRPAGGVAAEVIVDQDDQLLTYRRVR